MSDKPTTPLVEIRDLVKYFDLGQGNKVHAVDHVSLDIQPQEIVGLVGESGSGKSTLGKTLLGLHDKTAGEVRYAGQALPARYGHKDFRHYARQMQMIFQDPYSALNPRMTVGEIVGEGLQLVTRSKDAPISPGQVQEKVAHWLTMVGLSPDHRVRYPHEFSGGQRQRIGIARALIMEPDFVVCDEPISALDVSVQAQVINLLEDLSNEMGITLLFIAHDLSMVRYISDRMAVMYLGSLIEIGTSNEVFFNPQHPYTQALIASNPEPNPVAKQARKSSAIQGEIPSPVNVAAGCRFANRCPKVMPICKQATPHLLPIPGAGDDADPAIKPHRVACHLYH